MKLLSSMFFALFVITNVVASDGKTLFVKAECDQCHGVDNEFDSKQHKVKNLTNLKGWVSNCATHFEIEWFPEDEEKVIKYLNETHYKLKQ